MTTSAVSNHDAGAKPARHFLDLQGASVIRTPAFVVACEGLREAVEAFAISAIVGPPGVGKTFVLDTVEPELDLPVLRIEPELRPTMLSITTQLLELLTGDPGRGPVHRKLRPLIAALSRPRVIMVDEAQRMNRECLDHLRYLHDHRETNFALILAGGQGCWQVLGAEPQLRRRIWRPTFFEPLSVEEIVDLMPQFHPVWQTDPAVLQRIDGLFAGGILGNWAAITLSAVRSRPNGATRPVTADEVPGLLFRHGTQPGQVRDAA